MPRRHRGHPEETEPGNADLEGPAPADLLQMWITGRQPQTAATPAPVADEPPAPVEQERTDDPVEADPVPDPAPEPDPAVPTAREPAEEQARGWASFGHARTAEDVVERSNRNPWLDVLMSGTSAPPHPPAEPAKPALLRELDHDEEPADAARSDVYDPDATAHWTLEDFDAYDRAQTGADRAPDPSAHEELGAHIAPVDVVTGPAERVDLGWPEGPDDAWEDLPLPAGGLAAYAARWGSADDWQNGDWEPDTWQASEPPVAEHPPVLEVAAPPEESTPEESTPEPVDVVVEPVTPAQPSLFQEQVTGPDLPWDPDSTQDLAWTAVEHAGAAPADDDAFVEDAPAHDQWHDASGALWTSDDAGQTWYTGDGRGWNAETYQDIDPSEARRPAPPTTDRPEREPNPDPEPEPESGPGPTVSEPRQPEGRLGLPSTTAMDGDGPDIPRHVEYKQRAAYRPLLRILFVLAAVLALVAIFWAVAQGGQSSIGIAIGVTGFALAFWWGLLSWTPTVVSLHGPILEVARGADGERFDLRDPDLDIDVDDDTASRSWRVTITRSNGTELVIPASAVDPDEFSAIVQHYRGDFEHEDHPARQDR